MADRNVCPTLRGLTTMNRVVATCLGLALLASWPGMTGGQDKGSVEEFSKQLRSSDVTLRGSAAAALAKMGKEAVPVLVDALKDNDANIRGHAAHALGQIGPPARDAVPALVQALR